VARHGGRGVCTVWERQRDKSGCAGAMGRSGTPAAANRWVCSPPCRADPVLSGLRCRAGMGLSLGQNDVLVMFQCLPLSASTTSKSWSTTLYRVDSQLDGRDGAQQHASTDKGPSMPPICFCCSHATAVQQLLDIADVAPRSAATPRAFLHCLTWAGSSGRLPID
jgi:hypothetical protein